MFVRNDVFYRDKLTALYRCNLIPVIHEFNVPGGKVDVVALAPCSITAWEIKSEQDDLRRLCEQIARYQRVFSCVSVYVSRKHVTECLEKLPGNVAIWVDATSGMDLTSQCGAPDTSKIDPHAAVDCLRLLEKKSLFRRLGISFPNVPNTQRHEAIHDAIRNAGVYQDVARFHEEWCWVLKGREK